MRNGGIDMEYQQPDVRAMKSWRIGRLISFAVFAIIAAVVILIIWCTGWSSWWRYIIIGGAVLMAVVQGVAACILPQIEYRQWGYLIEEDKVVIRHGIFFIKKNNCAYYPNTEYNHVPRPYRPETGTL